MISFVLVKIGGSLLQNFAAISLQRAVYSTVLDWVGHGFGIGIVEIGVLLGRAETEGMYLPQVGTSGWIAGWMGFLTRPEHKTQTLVLMKRIISVGQK
jgi:membrane associated rhomboid family serine protease